MQTFIISSCCNLLQLILKLMKDDRSMHYVVTKTDQNEYLNSEHDDCAGFPLKTVFKKLENNSSHGPNQSKSLTRHPTEAHLLRTTTNTYNNTNSRELARLTRSI